MKDLEGLILHFRPFPAVLGDGFITFEFAKGSLFIKVQKYKVSADFY